jgi:hypothetical protein
MSNPDWAKDLAVPKEKSLNGKTFREENLPELLSGAAEFARRYTAPFLTVVEFVSEDGTRDYIPITHPDYKGKLADTPERAAALLAAVRLVTERDNVWHADSQDRQDIAKSIVVRK